MRSITSTVSIIVVIFLIVLFSSVFTVRQGQEALLLRFGQLQKNNKGEVIVLQPGLHFKMPFIEHSQLFDLRLQTLDINSSRILTAEKKYVLVDYYVKWQVNNLPVFYTSTSGNYQQAGSLLQQQLNDILKAQFGRRTIQEVVSQDRTKIMSELLVQANTTAGKLGMNVVDVRIKQIDLPETVTNTVYQQMQAERERVATEHRSQGHANAEAIKAAADANVTITIATAEEQAARYRAQGEAEAAKIYADAYGKDIGFYSFYKSLAAYQAAFASKNSVLVLSPDSQFFKYFNNANAITVAKKP